MRFVTIYCALLIVSICLIACSSNKKTPLTNEQNGVRELITYARGFIIIDYTDYKKITVRSTSDTTHSIHDYYLVKKGHHLPAYLKGVDSIEIPIQSLASLSTTHVGFLEALHLENKLIAFAGTRYIYNENVQQLVRENKIHEIGNESSLNYELLVSLHPSLIMAYDMGNAEYDHFAKLQSLHLTTVLNNEYLELTPLGEAEWIKYVAAFFDEDKQARTIFDSIATAYTTLKTQVETMQLTNPTVFTGLAFKGDWTVSGGQSFAANYLKDAGANYVWATDTKTGNFSVSLEDVILKAKNSDIWVNAGGATHLLDIKTADERYTQFKAYQHKQVFNPINRINANGGNDYWESGVINPQLVLKDLVKIFHPELLQAYTFTYYTQLK